MAQKAAKMNKTVHVFAHTHWDREWYFTTSRSKVYMMKELSDVLDTLENDPDFTTFLIDGQTSLIDEYLAWRPQDEARIKRAVSEKRLMVGPWYTQCDQFIVSAENVVRNLYYGIMGARRLGHSMNVGYVPDCFGQGGNMPQIYQAFGINDAIIVRGVSDDMAKRANFRWVGSDGSEVLVSQMRTGYSIAEWIPSDPTEADEFWEKVCLHDEAPRFATKHVLFPVGFDQAPIRRELPRILKERHQRDPQNHYVLDDLESYATAIREEAAELETVKGELISGKLRRVHRSIYSSRSDLKALNTATQNYVVNVLEPLMSMSWLLGNDYPHETIETIWKLLFENSAHDSIGSCVSDSVNEDVRMRYKQAIDISESLVALHSRLIATAIADTQNRFTVTCFNTLPEPRSEIMVKHLYIPGEDFALLDPSGRPLNYTVLSKKDLTEYVKKQTINLDPSRSIYVPDRIYEAEVAFETGDLPAFGYAQLSVELAQTSKDELHTIDHLENEHYRIDVNADGSLRVTDKATGFVYDHEAILEENGDDGDSFNYSPPRSDMVIRSTSFEPQVKLYGSRIIQIAEISFDMAVPADLKERSKGLAEASMPVTLRVALRKGSDAIDLCVHVKNNVDSHRLCLLIDSCLVTKFNYADELFGSIKRPNRLNQEREWYERDLENGVAWCEVPVAIQPTQSFVSLFAEGRGVAAFPQGVREYQIVNDEGHESAEGGVIRLTLFRTYGFMGKENLLYRPGHASGEETIATPAAQLRGDLEFKLGLAFFSTDFDKSKAGQLAKAYNTDVQAFEYASFLNGRLMFSEPEIEGTKPGEAELMEVAGDLALSALKKAENEDAIVIRLFNSNIETPASGSMRFTQRPASAWYTDLLEDKESGVVISEDGSIKIENVAPSKFVTVLVKFS